MKMADKKHNCENCVHKAVCALWEIQTGLDDSDCRYYQSIEPQNEWVSVKDGKPHSDFNVMIRRKHWDNVFGGRYYRGEFYVYDNECNMHKTWNVTHWLRAPELPEEKEE